MSNELAQLDVKRNRIWLNNIRNGGLRLLENINIGL